jgi:hypothetical protein|uniref:BHLH domain-containing protein n=1 Tax=Populus trichocarpa TaxID=3694 RepID=B9IQP2_POPTR
MAEYNRSCSTSSLVVCNERGELVEVTARVDKKTVSAERNITALMNVSEAERKPRAKINKHLDTLKNRVPGTHKLVVFFRIDQVEI